MKSNSIYLPLSDISLSIIPSLSIHVAANSLFAAFILFTYVSHIFFILSSVYRHLGFFRTLTIVNNYATLLNTNFYSNIGKKNLASICLSLLPYFSICSEFQQMYWDPSNLTFTPGARKHSPVTSSLKISCKPSPQEKWVLWSQYLGLNITWNTPN